VFDVNLLSHWYMLQEFVPAMIERKKGHVVATASLASFVGVPRLGDYCASKAGLLATYETLRSELYKTAPEIQISTIHPMFADTPLINPYRADLMKAKALIVDPETVAEAMAKQILSGTAGQVCVPERLGIIASLLRGLPHWLQEVGRR
jgi:all-trans-retinol dehydrogenase (NAD+)